MHIAQHLKNKLKKIIKHVSRVKVFFTTDTKYEIMSENNPFSVRVCEYFVHCRCHKTNTTDRERFLLFSQN